MYLLVSSISLASSPPDETTDARTAKQILPFQEESVARNDLHLQTSAEFYGEAIQLKYLFDLKMQRLTVTVKDAWDDVLEKIESAANQTKEQLEERIVQIQCSAEEKDLMRRMIEEIDQTKTHYTKRIKEWYDQVKKEQAAINEGLLNSLDSAALVTMSADIFRRCLGNSAALAELVKSTK